MGGGFGYFLELRTTMGIKLKSLLTHYQQGFIAQLVEHCTSIVEVKGSNPTETSDFFFWVFFGTAYRSCFIPAKITSTSILSPQWFTYPIHIHVHIHTFISNIPLDFESPCFVFVLFVCLFVCLFVVVVVFLGGGLNSVSLWDPCC